MADRTQRKIADRDNVNADDPFAELTKIMGFDPRVPVKRSEAEALRSLGSPASDDFEIDLEKEMLGEFALDDEPAAAQPVSRQVEARAPVAPQPAQEDDEADLVEFHADDFAPFEDFEPAAEQPAEADLRETRAEDEAVEVTDVSAEDDVDFDLAVTESMEDELVAAADTADEDERSDEEPVRAAAPDADLDAAFDTAMAEVDMDFRSRPDFVRPTAYLAEDDQADTEAQAVAETDDGLEDELNALLGKGGAHEQPVASTNEQADDELVDIEFDLAEDEPVAVVAAEPVAEAEPELEDFDLALEADEPVAAAAEPAAEEVELGELDWELDIEADAAETAEQPVTAGRYEDADEAAEDELAYAAEEFEPEVAAEPADKAWEDDRTPLVASTSDQVEDEVAFDEAAFAETFEDGLDDMLPEQDAARFETVRPAEAAPVVEPKAEDDEDRDPFEALRRMASPYTSRANFSLPQAAPAAAVASAAAAPVIAAAAAPVVAAATRVEAKPFERAPVAERVVPEIETIDVPESAVALADDLDIPELAFEEDVPQASVYDELDAEFSTLLNQMNVKDPAQSAPVATAAPRAADDSWLDRGRVSAPSAANAYAYPASAPAAATPSYAAPAQPAAYAPAGRSEIDDIEIDEFDLNLDDQSFEQSFEAAMADEDDQEALPELPDYDPDFDEDIPGMAPAAQQQSSRRGLWIAALVGGVAIVGGLGAFALSFGDGAGSDTPALVKADQSPIKVRPENPGGVVVPNQDNKVYQSVTGAQGGDAGPKQEKLVTTSEEPVDVKPSDDAEAVMPNMVDEEMVTDSAPATKGEDRIEQVIGDSEANGAGEIATVQPRKVRTMVVRPDGTLVPAEAPAAEAAPAKPAEPETTVASETTGAVPAPTAETPKPKPVAEAKPVEKPAEAKPEQVAAIDNTATATAAPAAGAWSMQIASQPSEAAAQSTYQDLARRYGGVLNGRGFNIVKADIPGKGTFWRVRVPAESRTAAINLCNDYKAAGGTCFVSK